MVAERRISLKADVQGADQVSGLQKALESIKGQSADAQRGLWQIGDALTQRTIPPLQDYKKLWDSSGQAITAFGGLAAGTFGKLSQEFQKQKTLGEFYGTGTIKTSMLSLNSATREYLSGGGRGFTTWLEGASSRLSQYRLVLAGAAAGMAAFGAAAAFSAKGTANLIDSTMTAHRYRIADEEKTRSWLESALTTDWSGGRSERTGIYDAIMSKRIMNEQTAITSTETLEKFYFANMERLKKMGIGSSEQLAQIMTSEGSSEEQLRMITGKYGMDKMTAVSRLNVMKSLTDDYDMDKEIDKRPEEVLKKRLEHTTTNIGKTLIPVLNSILGAFLKLSEVLGKIPGADKMAGWGIVLAAGAAAGVLLLSVLGSVLSTVMSLAPAIKLVGVAFRGALIGTGVGALLVAGALLVGFLYKTGMLQKAWDKFKGSNIGAGLFKGLAAAGEYAETLAGYVGAAFDRLDKAYSKGSITGGIKTILEFSSPMFKIFQFIGEHVKQLVDKSDKLQKLAKVGSVIMQKIHDFIQKLLGIVDSVRTGIYDLLSQIPGAEKREARGELEDAAARRGLKYKDGQFYNWDEKTLATNVPDYLQKMADDMEAMPGFWGEILVALLDLPKKLADAIKTALGIGTPALEGEERKQAFTEWAQKEYGGWASPEKLAAFFEYTEASDSGDVDLAKSAREKAVTGAKIGGYTMNTWVDKWDELGTGTSGGIWPAQLGNGVSLPSITGNPSVVTDNTLAYWPVSGAGDGLTEAQWIEAGRPSGYYYSTLGRNTSKEADLQAEATAPSRYDTWWGNIPFVGRLASADVGGQILSSGPLIGHEGEEIAPANVVRGAETMLEKYTRYGTGNGSAVPQVASVNANIKVDIGSVNNEADVDRLITQIRGRLLFDIRNDLENLQTRSIGYLRG